MPLSVTPQEPFLTSSRCPVPTVYVLLDRVSYDRRGLSPKCISATVGYYVSEEASRTADCLVLEGLPVHLAQEASAEQADGIPIFTFLEQLLRQRLEAALPVGTRIETVA